MSVDIPFTKENIDTYFKELGKIFRKLNGTKTPAEIMLVGGAAVLAGYGFRDVTYDIDAIIIASSAMKESISYISDKFGLPGDWLNTGVSKTSSYADKLLGVSKYYKTFSNIITVRFAAAEYLVAMKMMSGRQYKYDLSDIVGILWEHNKNGTPITREEINKAIEDLYGENADIPEISAETLGLALSCDDYQKVYNEIRNKEKWAKETLVIFDKSHPGKLKGENISNILEKARKKTDKSI